MSKDPMRRLRAADPAARLGLAADDAMREAIMTTDHTDVTSGQAKDEARAGRARRRRRVVLSGGLAAALVGGGVAYAAVGGWEWNRGTGPHDGLTCLTQWDSPETERSGGPLLTGDPIADCEEYQALTGLPAIADPVAFRVDGRLIVGPRGEVPAGATLEPVDPDSLALRELEASLRDEVDGLGSQCLDEQAAVVAARAELDRLGLDDWAVRVQERDPSQPEQECAEITYAFDVVPEQQEPADPGPRRTPVAVPADEDPASSPEPWSSAAARTDSPVTDDESSAPAPQPTDDVDTSVPRTLAVIPHHRPHPDSLRDQRDPFVYELRDALRAQIADECVDLTTAEQIAAEAIGAEHHWPTVVVEDPQASCTRVDLEVGGSVQVTLRGPRA